MPSMPATLQRGRDMASVRSTCQSAGLLPLLLTPVLLGQTHPAGEVSVTFYGPRLEPVPNAAITLRTPDWSLVKAGQADGSGEFFFQSRTSTWVYCCATAPGLTSGYEIAPRPTAERPIVYLDIRLFASAAVRGIVRDASGKPIAGAQVIGVLDSGPL